MVHVYLRGKYPKVPLYVVTLNEILVWQYQQYFKSIGISDARILDHNMTLVRDKGGVYLFDEYYDALVNSPITINSAN